MMFHLRIRASVLGLSCLAICAVGAPFALGQEKVTSTVHNLSAGGPGSVRSLGEGRVCVFCHTPHTAGSMTPLWNRASTVSAYQIYRSSTLDINPKQPTGSSKLCLSCHDGTIALGSVLSQSDRIRMSNGDYLRTGGMNLGTDLSDDHPVSFQYTSGLSAADRQLVSPVELPPETRLDNAGEMQCTTCHDAHDNSYGDFLVVNNSHGALCTICHRMDGWISSSHRNSTRTLTTSGFVEWPGRTVEASACGSCHRSHDSGRPERLLMFEEEEQNCLICHDGRGARTNIRDELGKRSGHDPRRYRGIHDAAETASGHADHVECSDCHNPHAVAEEQIGAQTGYAPIGRTLTRAKGTSSGGVALSQANFEYEVCLRCHGDAPVALRGRRTRQSDTSNLRLKFGTSSVSFHPLVSESRSSDTVSLKPGLSRGSLMRCTDCHNNDNGPRAGGQGPDGPHGSSYQSLLELNYTTTDYTLESSFEYALCYKCHRRSSILNNDSFKGHKQHIVDESTPCSACHDPHGVDTTQATESDHTHLINFDTVIVRPEVGSGRMEFKDLGRFRSSCSLSCHGHNHVSEEYE